MWAVYKRNIKPLQKRSRPTAGNSSLQRQFSRSFSWLNVNGEDQMASSFPPPVFSLHSSSFVILLAFPSLRLPYLPGVCVLLCGWVAGFCASSQTDDTCWHFFYLAEEKNRKSSPPPPPLPLKDAVSYEWPCSTLTHTHKLKFLLLLCTHLTSFLAVDVSRSLFLAGWSQSHSVPVSKAPSSRCDRRKRTQDMLELRGRQPGNIPIRLMLFKTSMSLGQPVGFPATLLVPPSESGSIQLDTF